MAEIFIVRHGEYDKRTEQLTIDGEAQMRNAAEVIVSSGKASGIVLSSIAIRASNSADTIAEVLDAKQRGSFRYLPVPLILLSPTAKKYGENPLDLSGFDQLEDEVNRIDGSANFNIHDGLIIVTHQPFVNVARALNNPTVTDKAGFGHVEILDTTLWTNCPTENMVFPQSTIDQE